MTAIAGEQKKRVVSFSLFISFRLSRAAVSESLTCIPLNPVLFF
jgi:hypothetical protein